MPADRPAAPRPKGLGRAVIRAALASLPAGPGVYRMIGAKGEALYVGKARNLKKRVAAYASVGKLSTRIGRMVAQTASVEVVATHTEVEAFYDLYYLEVCCEEQFTVVSSGAAPRLIEPEVIEHTQAQFTAAEGGGPALYFEALKRRLDAEEPDYRT